MHLKKITLRILSLALTMILLFGCTQGVFAATPSSTSSLSATLAYTLKGLPLGRAIQNFYVGSTYIYITQRVDATTYVSRLKINGAEANYMDRMTMNNCGHGQSLDFYTHNGTEYLLMGCKSDTPADSDYNWSLQMARFVYEAGKTYDYTELNRLSYMNYANKSASRLGTTYRVAGGANNSYIIFRIQTKEGSVTYSAYDKTKLNNLLDKSESVRMDSADAKAACSFSFTQSGSSIIRPNSSFQGIDISSKNSIYLTGGADGDVPQIAMMNSSGSYKKLVKVTNVGNLEIEGVKTKNGNVYFVIVPSTVAADKKEKHKIYYIPESKFGISHTMTTVAGKAPTCTATGLSEAKKCTTCSQLLDIQETLPALGHTTYNVDAIPATCTTDGMTAGTKCSTCGVVVSGCTTIAATGHNVVEIPGVAGSCTTDGVTAGSKCSTCGVVLSGGQVSSAPGHNTVEVTAVAPTCTTDGMTAGSKCTTCGEIFSGCEVLPATGHAPVDVPAVEANCLTHGVTAGTKCNTCGEILSGCETLSLGDHTTEIIPGSPAGCLSSGISDGEKCGVCGVILKAQEVLPRLGHDYTYVNLGDTHSYSCSRCDKADTVAHTFVDDLCICGAKDNIPTLDTTITIGHTLNLASDISVNFAVKSTLLKDYVNHFMAVEIPIYEGNEKTGSRTEILTPVLNGSYYYYTLTGLTAVNMRDEVIATLYMEKDGKFFASNPDTYSVAQYAYSQLNKAGTADSLKALCADLLRYGKEAQVYKSYRLDSLADANMTADHCAYLSDAETVVFGSNNETLADLENPVITWAGKSLSLDSKVAVKYIFNLGSYTGSVDSLTLKVRYVNRNGESVETILSGAELYNANQKRYAFTFDGLLAAELRSVVDVAIYQGNTRLSQTLRYSPDTYGNNKSGQLLTLCRALFAYSDTAKAYFS